jgi:Flp pilus assembly protein TadG
MINKIKAKFKSEKGSAEIVSALITIPIFLIILTIIIDTGNYYFAKGTIADTTKEFTRQVAIYGGSNSSLAVNKNGGQSVQTKLRDNLVNKMGGSVNITNVSCTSATGIEPGSEVSCSTTYSYNATGGLGAFGINTYFTQPITITQYSISETWGY